MLENQHETLKRILNSGKLEPYIRHIRFPQYRNLTPMLEIDFTHPITALIGPNGTNKTAILRALQGCPDQTSVGMSWFSTNLDPINDGHRFVHGYYSNGFGKTVEAIKMRISAKGAKSAHRRIDRDYFEPSRPILSAGMEPMPSNEEYPESSPDRTQTRWKAIDKKVLYLDFRTEVSAFDKYFHHGPVENDASTQQRKDRIRQWSGRLALAFENSLKSDEYFTKERILTSPFDASQSELDAISDILGRKYDRIRFVRHNYFHPPGLNSPGWTVRMSSGGLRYSEAFAGSGEYAVAMIVHRISNAEECSLILLDEPEVSLHPRAQKVLLTFLADQVKRKKHQIIFASHSPDMIRSLPPDAIKVLDLNPTTNKVFLTSTMTNAHDAFVRLGIAPTNRLTIHVEDDLAEMIILRALRPLSPETLSQLRITILGGASKILQQFVPAMAKSQETKVLVILDGDQDRLPIPNPEECPPATFTSTLEKICKGKPLIFVDGGNDPNHVNKIAAAEKELLTWMHRYLRYLPGGGCPEVLLGSILGLDLTDLANSPADPKNAAKEYWREEARVHFDRESSWDPGAAEISTYQRLKLAEVDPNHETLANIRNMILPYLG